MNKHQIYKSYKSINNGNGKGNKKLSIKTISSKSFFQAFTLVELIIVIVILAILATIAFLSFNSYSASARDSQRVSDARNITKGLGVAYTMAGKYPIPDSKININSGSVNIGYQGKAGESVLRRIQMSADGGIDPISGSYYTYSTNNKQSKYEVMGFLETQDNPILQDGGLELTRGKGYVFTMGDELGIITESTGGITYTFDSTTPSLAIEGSGDDKYVNINSGSVTDNPDIKIITSTTNTPTTGDDISDVVYIGYTSTSSINVSSLIERVTPLDIFASCTISGVTIKNNESRDFYSEENISYSASYDCSSKMETRKCINGTLNGDSSFSYISCVKGTPNNYAANPSYVYNGHTYSIPALTHLETYTSGIDSLPVSENNGSFKYTLTSITCNDGTVGSENETGPFLISCDSGFVDSGSNTCIVPISNPVAKASTSITSTSITWNWEVVSGATRYEFSTDNSTWSDKGNVLTFNETGLSPLTDYTRYVRACNSSNCSGGVSLGSVSTLAPPPLVISSGDDIGVGSGIIVSGGVPPYSYIMTNGTINASGIVTSKTCPSGQIATTTITVTDLIGNSQSITKRIGGATWIKNTSLSIDNTYTVRFYGPKYTAGNGSDYFSYDSCSTYNGSERYDWEGYEMIDLLPSWAPYAITGCPVGTYNHQNPTKVCGSKSGGYWYGSSYPPTGHLGVMPCTSATRQNLTLVGYCNDGHTYDLGKYPYYAYKKTVYDYKCP